MSTIRIEPEANTLWYKYTLIDPVSHKDPGQVDRSNFSMFRRQRRWISVDQIGESITQSQIDRVTTDYAVPAEIADWFADEPVARFFATCLCLTFIEHYSGKGLFDTAARYRRLEERMTQTAARTNTLKSFWSVLTHEMKVPPLAGAHTYSLMQLLVQPPAFVTDVLYQFAKYSQLIRMMAQGWNEQKRLGDPEYAQRVNKPQSSGETVALHFEPPRTDAAREISIALPVHSGNDIRHDVRQSLMYHLLDRLDITFDDTLPLHIRTLLENAGALSESSPGNSFQRAQIVCKNYPHLALLGGSMPGYMLGESRLQAVGAYYKGYENNASLAEIGVHATESVIDLLDLWVLTQHSTLTEANPLPYEIEVMQSGAELYVRFQLHPFIKPVEIGAFAAAMETFKDTEGAIGGQTARGFGRVHVECLKAPEDLYQCQQLYEDYLVENQDSLRAWLVDGTLGTEA